MRGSMKSSVYAITGTQDLLRRRHVQKIVREQEKNGWRIDRVDGTRPHDVRNALFQGGFIIRDQALVIIEKPEKAPLDALEAHAQSGDKQVVALLDYEGNPKKNTKFGKFVLGLGKAHANFPAPEKSWEFMDVAVDFCIKEAKEYGKELKPDLARVFISRVGYDLGILAFELLKITTLAEIGGSKEIKPDHIGKGMAAIAEAAVEPLTDALASRNRKKIIQVLERLKRSHKGDPTIRITKYIQSSVFKWLGVAVMQERGLSPRHAAAELGLNPWVYEKCLLAQVSRWDSADLRRLIEVLALSRRAVLNGHLRPWTEFTARLLHVCG